MGKGNSSVANDPILGPRGKPKTIEQAYKSANPNYGHGRQYSENCQRCVFAYEMLRRGYDVEAKPALLNGRDTLPYADNPRGWKAVLENMQTVKMPSRKTIENMDSQMASWGDGARAIVRVKWKGRNYGHVFIAEQQNGQTVYIEPQTGRTANINAYMDQAVKGRTELVRIDNLKPTQLIDDCVKRRSP